MNYKTIIAPIVAVVCLGIATVTHHAISQDVQTEVVDVALAVVGCGVSVWGIIKNHK